VGGGWILLQENLVITLQPELSQTCRCPLVLLLLVELSVAQAKKKAPPGTDGAFFMIVEPLTRQQRAINYLIFDSL
jgi:hypothetical protein